MHYVMTYNYKMVKADIKESPPINYKEASTLTFNVPYFDMCSM